MVLFINASHISRTFLKFTKEMMRRQITIMTRLVYSEWRKSWSNSVFDTAPIVMSFIQSVILSDRNVRSILLLFFPTLTLFYLFIHFFWNISTPAFPISFRVALFFRNAVATFWRYQGFWNLVMTDVFPNKIKICFI